MSKVSDTARNFIQQYSALTEFATALVAEGYDEEKNANLKSENEKLDDAIGRKRYQLDKLGIDMAAQKTQAQQIEKDKARILAEADQKASLIIKDADEEAEKRIATAKARVAEIKKQAAQEQDEASKRIADLQREVGDLAAEKDLLRTDIAALKQKFM